MYFLNPNLINLHRVFNHNNRKDYLRLDLNENPGGLPEDFIHSVLADVTPEFVSQYPETINFTNVLASNLNVNKDNICLVNGSSEGIRYIIQAFTSEEGRIIGVTPSYFMYQVYAEMYGRKFIKIPYDKDLFLDINSIINEMNEETQLLILMNPNNPMGNVYSTDQCEKMIDVAQKKEITVLIDEAYYYFYPKSFINFALERDYVFIVRTFSKFFSMAGCRLGYVVGKTEGIRMIQRLCTPHNTNALALKMAQKLLEEPKLIENLTSNYLAGRDYLVNWLRINGYSFVGEAGNFLFIKPKSDATMIVEKMKTEKKILIKSYRDIGKLGHCLRVTIGDEIYMKIFTEALAEIDRVN